MPVQRARRTDLSGRAGRPDGVIYRQQYVGCGKVGCRRCPPTGPGHGPYWYGFYWDYRQRTRSFYVGKTLPAGVEPLVDIDDGGSTGSTGGAGHVLEESFTLVLANAAHIRNVPGRKTDVNEAMWIADLLAHGLIRGSFVPPATIQELRTLMRTRKRTPF